MAELLSSGGSFGVVEVPVEHSSQESPSRVAQVQQHCLPSDLGVLTLSGRPAAGCAPGPEQRIQGTLEQEALGGEADSSAQPSGCYPHKDLLPQASQRGQT